MRVVRLDGGTLVIGRTLPGRGAWLCAGSSGCLDVAVRRKAFARALRAPVSDDATTSLRENMVGRATMDGPPPTDCTTT